MDKEQELNGKLAEWAGFKFDTRKENFIVVFPDGVNRNIGEVPNFTQSLDACFKWLVPKLHGRYKLEGTGGSHYATVWENSWQFIEIQGKTPTLALCLAIEKLISADY